MNNLNIASKNSFDELQSTIKSRLKLLEGSKDVYWSCDGNPVWTKYQAMKNLKSGQSTHFYCYDKQWAQGSWNNPTNTDIHELLIERAKEIRRNNDYVRIPYSGGADSHTALVAFKEAGVAPDEIFFYTWYWEGKSFFNSNYEIDSSVIPYISTLKEWFPKAKIRHANLDFERLKAYRLLHPDHMAFELGTGIRSIPSAGVVACFPDMEIGNGIITITGSDKPRLDYINGNWYAWFTDASSNHLWGNGVEGFYQYADPTISIKQSHLMKDFLLKTLPEITRKSVLAFQAWQADKVTRETMNKSIGRHLPFNDIAMSRKLSKRPAAGFGETHTKAVMLFRALKYAPGSNDLFSKWETIKRQFEPETGYCPTIEVFGKFYNLDTGEIHSVDDLFPNGWNNK